MIFHTITYAIFLVIVFLLYWGALGKSVRAQNVLLLCCSYLFYAWWDWRFVGLIVFSSVVDYFAAILIDTSETQGRRRAFLLLSLVMNLGLLFFFKYFNFLADTINFLSEGLGSGKRMPFKDIILPIGISFYTFQALSYTIDVYRRKIPATRDALAYFVFVSFFPQIAAGPIERAIHLLPQFRSARILDFQRVKEGLRLILWGVFKKVAVADLLATYVDIVYQSPHAYSGISSLLACVFFTIQLYCDFSGYSDMAIGSAKLLGFHLSRNFNTPLFSKSLTELWTRWHISLNTWFRDYVYIPLGGNKGGKWHRFLNIFIVFLISGLWHGASWKFVFWGAFHGIIVILEQLVSGPRRNNAEGTNMLSRFFGALKVFSLLSFAFIFFRAVSFNDAVLTIGQIGKGLAHQLASAQYMGTELLRLFLDSRECIMALSSIALFITLEFLWRKEGVEVAVQRYPKAVRWGTYYALILWMCFVGEINDASSFVYFQF